MAGKIRGATVAAVVLASTVAGVGHADAARAAHGRTANSIIYACYRGPALRLIPWDYSCATLGAKWKPISWNRTGPEGPAGPAGLICRRARRS